MSAVNREVAARAERLRKLNYVIENSQNILDAAALILDEANDEKRQLIVEIELLLIEDAFEYPSIIYA